MPKQVTPAEIKRLEAIEGRIDKLEEHVKVLVKDLEQSDRLIDELEKTIGNA
jgi:hypothetical protein